MKMAPSHKNTEMMTSKHNTETKELNLSSQENMVSGERSQKSPFNVP